jgi:hypothetical protein
MIFFAICQCCCFFHEQNPRESTSIHLNGGAIVKVLLVFSNSIFGFVSSEESVAPISLPATGEKRAD